MTAMTFFDEFLKYQGDGTIDLDSHTFKLALTNSAPVPGSNMVLADITQIGTTGGYSTGGFAILGVTWSETGSGTGVWRFSFSDVVITATGGTMGPFRYAVLYDDTPTSPADPLVGYWDYGSSVSVTDGNSFILDIQTGGVFELSHS